MAEHFVVIPQATIDLERQYLADIIVARRNPAGLYLLHQIVFDAAHGIAAHFPVVTVEQFLFPFQEFGHPILRQTEQVEHDEDREFFGEVGDEIARALVLELVDQGAGALAHLVLQREHFLRGEMAVERLAIGGVDRRIGLCRDHQPIFTDILGPFAHAVFREIVGVAQHRLHVFGIFEQPAGLVAGKDVGDIGDRRQVRVHLRDQHFVRIVIGHLAREQRQGHRQFGGDMGWQGLLRECGHGNLRGVKGQGFPLPKTGAAMAARHMMAATRINRETRRRWI